jgi:hypothetical protein
LGCHAMVIKQLQGMGVPTWLTPQEHPDADMLSIRVWTYCGDCGPDQVRFKKLVHTETVSLSHDVFVDSNCVLHQLHLGVKSGLTLADSWLKKCNAGFKYFASVAKICNVWRANAKRFMKIWTTVFGATKAVQNCGTLIPRCLSGRWGSIAGAADRIAKAGMSEFSAAIVLVLCKTSTNAARRRAILANAVGGGCVLEVVWVCACIPKRVPSPPCSPVSKCLPQSTPNASICIGQSGIHSGEGPTILLLYA